MFHKEDGGLFSKLLDMADSIEVSLLKYKVLASYNYGLSRKKGAEYLNISEGSYAWHLRYLRSAFSIKARADLRVLHSVLTSKGINIEIEKEINSFLEEIEE